MAGGQGAQQRGGGDGRRDDGEDDESGAIGTAHIGERHDLRADGGERGVGGEIQCLGDDQRQDKRDGTA